MKGSIVIFLPVFFAACGPTSTPISTAIPANPPTVNTPRAQEDLLCHFPPSSFANPVTGNKTEVTWEEWNGSQMTYLTPDQAAIYKFRIVDYRFQVDISPVRGRISFWEDWEDQSGDFTLIAYPLISGDKAWGPIFFSFCMTAEIWYVSDTFRKRPIDLPDMPESTPNPEAGFEL